MLPMPLGARAFALTVGMSCAGAAMAQAIPWAGADGDTPQTTTDWHAHVTPYVWAAGVRADIRPLRNGPTVQTSKSFSDILENLNAAAFVSGLARRDRLVLRGDFTYANMSESGTLPLGVPASVQLRQTSLTLTGGYRAWRGADAHLDVMAGARLWDVRTTAQLGPLGSVRTRASFVDPLLAVRWWQALAPRWSAVAYADVGGFGAGSRLTWQAVATVNYAASERWYVSAGYRYLSVDYRASGRRLDFAQQGPLVGVTYAF